MKREDKSRRIREKILDVSRELFIEQGYGPTTIRRILSATGLTTGSLYHFFRDKEDILFHLAENHLEETDELVQSLIPPKSDPVLSYSLIIALQLSAVDKYERVAEIYLSMYRSWPICDMICRKSAEKNRLHFEKYSRGMSDEWWYSRSIAITGIIQNCIAERLNSSSILMEERLRIILTGAFAYFNIPQGKVSTVIDQCIDIVSNNTITIYGLRI